MPDPTILYPLIIGVVLVGVLGTGAWWVVSGWLDQLSGSDAPMEHVGPNESPEVSSETQRRLLAIGMAEQHERRR